jgi:osmoprotectant transport system permease protein
VSTVAIAMFAFFAGAVGLGEPLYADIGFKTNVIMSGGLAILMAVAFDALLVVAGRLVSPWRRVRAI